MNYVTIDGTAVSSLAEVHRYLAKALGFPPFYGNNLDALRDCLTDLGEDTVIFIAHPDVLLETLGAGYTRLCQVLEDAEEENPHLHIRD